MKSMNVPTDVEQRQPESKELNVPAADEPRSSEELELQVDVRYSEAAAAAERSSDEREWVLDKGTDISEAQAVWI